MDQMQEYEKAIDMKEKNYTPSDKVNENAIEWIKNEKTMTVTFSQPKYINRIKTLAEEKPEDIQIIVNKSNYIVAHIPVKYLQLRKPVTYTEEQKKMYSERIKKVRKNTHGYEE